MLDFESSSFDEENSHLLDLDRLIEQVIESGLDPSVFDHAIDIEYAKNVIDFALNPDFLDTVLWAKQAEQAVRLFSEYCPECTDMDFFNDVPVDAVMGTFKSKVVLLENGVCPVCSKNKKELFKELPFELVSCLGQRAGKTALTGGVLAPYYVHKFLQIPNPARHYGLMKGSFFQMTFVAVTAGQAYESVWMAFKGAIANSPWFQKYIARLHAIEKERNLEKGDLVKVLDTGILFKNKMLSCSFAAADMKSLRGRTRVFCVSGDTSIVTNSGIVHARDISSLEDPLFLTKDGGYKKVTRSFERETDTLRIVSSCGYELTGSTEHPVLIANPDATLQYKPLGELSEGDVLVISRDPQQMRPDADPGPLPAPPKKGPLGHNNRKYIPTDKMTADLAYLLGILAAEGYLTKKVVRWHTSDKDILDKSLASFESVFGTLPKVIPHDSLEENWSPGWYIEAQSPIVYNFLKGIGLSGKSHEKTVPWSILRSNSSCVRSFLAGYLDGDGNVEFDSEGKAKAVTVHSKSEDLLREVQLLLLSLGIVSHRSKYTREIKGKEGTYYKLQMFGKNVGLFSQKVELIPRKRGSSTPSEYIDTDRVYLDLGELHTMSEETNFALYYKRNYQNSVYASTIKKKFSVLQDSHPDVAGRLSEFFEQNLFFDPVKSIEETGIQKVYDWTVEDEHNFIGNGIIQHNCAIDELGWFNSSDMKRANADETYAALSNSLRTIRSASDRLWDQGNYNTLPGYMANFSSPSSQYDKIMRLLKEGERDKRKVCFHMASWEASPLITRKSLSSEELNDPVKFWRDFGAVPPLANNPFIESESAIKSTQSATKPVINWRPKYVQDKVNPDMRYIAAELVGNVKDRLTPRLIAVDGGERQNSFAIGIFRMEPKPDGGFQIIQDAIIEAKPEKIERTNEVIPVHFPTMFDLVLKLSDKYKGLNVLAVVYDRWQSTGEVQRLREMKVKAERYSPKESDFKILRNMVYSGDFKTPKWEHKELSDLDISNVAEVRKAPYTHQAIQFATVRSVGKKIVKPEVGEDDLFRVCVLGAHYLIDNQKDFISKNFGASKDRGSIGTVAMKTSNSTYFGARSKTNIGSVRGKYKKF